MSTVFLHLTKQIDELCKNIESDLVMGHAGDFGEYQFACGRYRGLLTAKEVIVETANRLEHDDDE